MKDSSVNNRSKLLYLTSRFPYPLEKGDKLRAYYQIKELSKTFDVTLVSLSEQNIDASQIKELEPFCQEIIVHELTRLSIFLNTIIAFFTKKPIQVGYFYRFSIALKISKLIQERHYDHIYCQLIRTSEYVKNIHHIPKTLDYMDSLSEGIRKRIKREPFYTRWIFKIEAKRLMNYERSIFDYFENKTIISEQDRSFISHPQRNEIICIPNGIDTSFFEDLPREEQYDFVFVGNMSYPPNIDAVKFIAHEILPSFSGSKFLISGATPHPAVLKLEINNSNITVSGWVNDIRTSYCSGKIFLAPMMIGTGLQNKLLEAMALKTPCITTALTNNAINAENGIQLIVADSKEEMMNAIKDLLQNPEKRKTMAEEARVFVKERFSWEKSTEILTGLIKLK